MKYQLCVEKIEGNLQKINDATFKVIGVGFKAAQVQSLRLFLRVFYTFYIRHCFQPYRRLQ